mgnify:CR=1 FL=1
MFQDLWKRSGLKVFRSRKKKFSSYLARFCPYPLSSPVFGEKKFTDTDIAQLEAHFEEQDWDFAPFVLFEQSRQDLQLWGKRDFKHLQLSGCYLFGKSNDLSLPQGYSAQIVKFSTPRGAKVYSEVGLKVFGLDEKFLISFRRLCKLQSSKNELIVVSNKKGTPVAIAGIVCFSGLGLLHSVAVLPRYQGKGLSKWLLAEAQQRSQKHGTKVLLYFSNHERIVGQAHAKKSIDLFYKF